MLTVNSPLDNLTPGDGLVTLREAIVAANTDSTTDLGETGDGPDTIVLPMDTYTLNIAGTHEDSAADGDLDITSQVAILGNGAANTVIDGGAQVDDLVNTPGIMERVLHVLETGDLTLEGVTVTGGNAADAGHGSGGAIYNEGGSLSIGNSTISGNSAAANGGGISNENGTLTVDTSTISGNSADGGGGGGIRNFGTMTVTDSTISGNSTILGSGGGIRSNGGMATVTNSTISDNSIGVASGAGIYSGAGTAQFPGRMTVMNSTISDNTTRGDAGGISSFGSMTLINSTVSSNQARGFGGGLRIQSSFVAINSTISGNTADSDGNSHGTGGGIFGLDNLATNISLFNTIVADNRQGRSTTANDIAGKNVDNSSRNNLIGDSGSSGGLGNGSQGNIVGADPLLGPLQHNGGPTETHALLAGSPAIDAGHNGSAVDAGGSPLVNDQRGAGFVRIIDSGGGPVVDIGAVEHEPAVPCSLNVTTTSDDGVGSLRSAIHCANATVGVDTIAFDILGVGPHTISPLSPLPTITDAVIIDGTSDPDFAGAPGVEIDGSSAGADASGLTLLDHTGSMVRGLVINRFAQNGVLIDGGGMHVLRGNFIGTDLSGSLEEGNRTGVFIMNSANNLIGVASGGAASDRNLISGNRIGVRIERAASTGNTVAGNLIGTDLSGDVALGNSIDGVKIRNASGNRVGGTTVVERNVIAANNRGVYLQDNSSNNHVTGNYVGTDVTGGDAVGNVIGALVGGASNNFIGGSVSGGEGNVLSGNTDGVRFINGATANLVEGNLIGTDASGDAATPNTRDGVRLVSPGNTIGSTDVDRRNVISGNSRNGILALSADAAGNTVLGNLIGTSATGNAAVANQRHGIFLFQAPDIVVGGVAAGAGNVISGNGASGVRISQTTATGIRIEGNAIGLGADGVTAIANRSGIVVANMASNNTIGGTVAGAGNQIAHNAKAGVTINGGTGNAIQQNSIFDNGELGIDLSPNVGPTANDPGDADTGANNLQNSPVIGSVVRSGDLATVGYQVASNAANSAFPLTIEFYLSDDGEGRTFLGSDTIIDNTAQQTLIMPAGPATVGTSIVATATDVDGNTSEFSAPAPVLSALTAAGGAAGLPDLYDADAAEDLMYGWLEAGVRKTSLEASIADEAFAGF